MSSQAKSFELQATEYIQARFKSASVELKPFVSQIEYSFLNFGKVVRPNLVEMLVSNYGAQKSYFEWALSVELIHCYSLLHDDLPCADNSGYRRGQPSHHRKFSESDALLIGSALSFEAFGVIAKSYPPELSQKLTEILSDLCGFSGLIGGQLLDLSGHEDKKLVSSLKTGCLFKAAALGSVAICDLEVSEARRLSQTIDLFGVWFQAMDDEIDGEGWDNLEEIESSLKKSFESLRIKEPFLEYWEEVKTQFWLKESGS